MTDITKCHPTKFLKKCIVCYRWTAPIDGHQSYSDFYADCSRGRYKYYILATAYDPMPKNKSNKLGRVSK